MEKNLLEQKLTNKLVWNVIEKISSRGSASPKLSILTDETVESLLLQQARYDDIQKARASGSLLEGMPTMSAFEEDQFLQECIALQPLPSEIINWMAKCPASDWDAFYERRKRKSIILKARTDPNTFMEYCFVDKDGTPWRQETFHRDWQAMVPTADETKEMIKGKEVRVVLSDGPFVKKLTTLIGAPREHAKCLAGCVKVLLADGKNKRADEIPLKTEFEVIAWSQKDGFSKQKARVWQNTIQSIVKIRTASEKEIKVSPEHPFWTTEGWISAEKLTLSDFVATVNNFNVTLITEQRFCWDRVTSVELQPEEMTYSIEVDNAHTHITEGIITHNTTQMSVGRVIWELGNNPSLRIKVITAADSLGKDIVFDIAQNIERNERIAEVFPHLIPDYKAGWTKLSLFVQRPVSAGKDASVEAKSVLGSGAGGRADILIFDDVIDQRNAVANPALREQVKNAIENVWLPLMPRDGRAWYSATPWHTGDYTHHIKKSSGWASWWKPTYTEKTDKFGRRVRNYLWKSKWHEEALKIRRSVIGERAFTRQFLLVAISNDEATFKETELRASYDLTRWEIGQNIPKQWPRFAGCDLASGLSKKDNAWTVIFTIAIDPSNNRRIPVELVRKKLNFNETIAEIQYQYQKHQWELILVENNGYQQAVIDALPEYNRSIPVQGYHTGSKKADEDVGLPGLAVVFGHGGWAIPAGREHTLDCECILCIWLSELRLHPLAEFSDTVMATWFAERAAVTGGSGIDNKFFVLTSNAMQDSKDLDEEERILNRQRARDRELRSDYDKPLSDLDIESLLWGGAFNGSTSNDGGFNF